jgi:hypothetical protein
LLETATPNKDAVAILRKRRVTTRTTPRCGTARTTNRGNYMQEEQDRTQPLLIKVTSRDTEQTSLSNNQYD